ncbi:MAG: SIMPL domain-containing protein [Massilia sp.]
MIQKIAFACLFGIISLAARAGELPAYPFIHVSGASVAYVMPNIGEIDFEIASQDPDPAAALQAVAARVAEVRALIADLGSPEDKVDVRDMRKAMTKKGGVLGYDLRCAVKVTVTDLSKWKAIMVPLLEKPDVDGLTAALDTTERAKVDMELLSAAIQDARRKGEGMAAAFGRKLGPVGGATPGELKNLTRAMNLASSEYYQRSSQRDVARPDRDELVAVTMLKLAHSVDVVFKIK